MSKGWRDSSPRFTEIRKPLVERPPVLETPDVCWCGEQHGGEGKYKYAGDHPWEPLPEPDEK